MVDLYLEPVPACACLCMLAGGDWANGGIAFIAAVCGLFARQEVLKMRFNPLISFIVGIPVDHPDRRDATRSTISDASPEKALATSVLYLVPGVPLINCVIDLIEGYIPTAVARGVFGGFILLCIAVGMSLAIMLLGYPSFPIPDELHYFLILRDIAFAFVVAVGFAILFNTPRRVLYMAGLLGGLGHCIRFMLLQNDVGPGLRDAGRGGVHRPYREFVCAHRVHVPPVVFTMPACITMIPGAVCLPGDAGLHPDHRPGTGDQGPGAAARKQRIISC